MKFLTMFHYYSPDVAFESRLDYERFQRLLEEATQQETPQTQRVTSLTQTHADSLLDRLAARLGLDGGLESNGSAVSNGKAAAYVASSASTNNRTGKISRFLCILLKKKYCLLIISICDKIRVC